MRTCYSTHNVCGGEGGLQELSECVWEGRPARSSALLVSPAPSAIEWAHHGELAVSVCQGRPVPEGTAAQSLLFGLQLLRWDHAASVQPDFDLSSSQAGQELLAKSAASASKSNPAKVGRGVAQTVLLHNLNLVCRGRYASPLPSAHAA